jgi:hypothetical protein
VYQKTPDRETQAQRLFAGYVPVTPPVPEPLLWGHGIKMYRAMTKEQLKAAKKSGTLIEIGEEDENEV